MSYFLKKRQKGFTLIELLVVVSIISLLSSILIASLSNARGRACDARRMEDLSQLNNALQLYILDNGEAPPTTDEYLSSNGGGGWGSLSAALEPYLNPLPVDPCPNGEAVADLSAGEYSYIGNLSYVYRRIDDWYGPCRNGEAVCDTTGYILDVTSFQKREKTQPYVYSFGSPYPAP